MSLKELSEEVQRLHAENKRLRHEIACACNALRDSILVSGNDLKTNLHWVKRLEKVIETDLGKLPEPPPRTVKTRYIYAGKGTPLPFPSDD